MLLDLLQGLPVCLFERFNESDGIALCRWILHMDGLTSFLFEMDDWVQGSEQTEDLTRADGRGVLLESVVRLVRL